MSSNNKIKSPLTKGIAKIPVIMQMEALECGAASLAMVLAYYGLWIPLKELRKECGISRDGSNLMSIYSVAESHSLKPRAFRYTAESLRDKGTFPCIGFWDNNHFVVIDGFKLRGTKAVINDHARCRITIPFQEFEESYSGICLFFSPDDDFKPGGFPASIIEFAKQRLTRTFPMFMMIFLTTLIASMTGILLPAFSRFFVDHVLTRNAPQWSGGFFILLGLVIASQVTSSIIKAVYMLKFQGKMAAIANTSFLWHILRLPVEFFEQRMSGDIAQRQQSNQDIVNTLLNTFAPLIFDSVAMIFNLIIMINYSPFLALIGISSVALKLVIARIISEKRINITRVQMRAAANLNSTALSGINMIETIKSSGAENGFFTRWAGFQADSNAQTVKYTSLNMILGQVPLILDMLSSNIILFLGVKLVMRGSWTIGLISAFNGYLLAFSTPASSLIQAGQRLQEMRTSMERVQDVFKYPIDSEYSADDNLLTDEDLKKLSGLVEIKNLTFGYNRLVLWQFQSSVPVLRKSSSRLPELMQSNHFPSVVSHHEYQNHGQLVQSRNPLWTYPLPEGKLSIKDLVSYAVKTVSLSYAVRIVIAALLVIIFSMAAPFLMRIIYSETIYSNNLTALTSAFVFIIMAGISSNILETVKNMTISRIQIKTGVSIHAAIIMRLINLPAEFFKKYTSGEIAKRVSMVDVLCNFAVNVIFSSGLTAAVSLIYLNQIFMLTPALVKPSLLIVLALLLSLLLSVWGHSRLFAGKMEIQAKEYGMLYSFITGIQKIKLSGSERRAFSKWAELYKEDARLEYNPPLFLKLIPIIQPSITVIGTFILYFCAFSSGVSPEDYMAFDASYALMSAAFVSLSAVTVSVSAAPSIINMLRPILEALPEIHNGKTLSRVRGEIELNNVSFRYSEKMPLILDGLSLKIRPREYIAVVGRSGCGKSTLMRLLLGFEHPEGGVIYYDGSDLKTLDVRSLRRNIGCVMQNSRLFQGSIYSNIVISAPQLSENDAWEAAEMAGIADDIRRMPM